MVVGKVMIIKTRLPGSQKFAGSARTLLRSTRLCHQISATATDCIQATTPSKQDYGLHIFLLATHIELEVLMIIKDIGSLGFWMGMREECPLLFFYRGLVRTQGAGPSRVASFWHLYSYTAYTFNLSTDLVIVLYLFLEHL